MLSVAIVEQFDIFKDMAADSLFVFENYPSDAGALVSSIEGLLSCIIIAVSLGTHTLSDAKACQQTTVFVARIRAATIAVMYQSFEDITSTSACHHC